MCVQSPSRLVYPLRCVCLSFVHRFCDPQLLRGLVTPREDAAPWTGKWVWGKALKGGPAASSTDPAGPTSTKKKDGAESGSGDDSGLEEDDGAPGEAGLLLLVAG
jgi:hypothetical protein